MNRPVLSVNVNILFPVKLAVIFETVTACGQYIMTFPDTVSPLLKVIWGSSSLIETSILSNVFDWKPK